MEEHQNSTDLDDADLGDDGGIDDNYWGLQYKIAGTLIYTPILLVGVLGNIMVVAVVRSTRAMHSPTNCYLVSLAVADLVVLLTTVPNEIISYYTYRFEWHTGQAGCSMFLFSYNAGINASSLNLIAFTIERYVAICQPMRAHTICTVKRAMRIIMAVWIFTICYCLPWFFLGKIYPMAPEVPEYIQENIGNTTVGENVTVVTEFIGSGPIRMRCGYKFTREQYLYYYLTDFLLFYAIPLGISCYLYICIALVLFPNRVTRKKGEEAVIHLEVNNGSGARYQVVKMLVVVVAVFAVLWLPYRGLLVYNSVVSHLGEEQYLDAWYLLFAKTCVYANCLAFVPKKANFNGIQKSYDGDFPPVHGAINPILYNVMSRNFRRAFCRLLRCGTATSHYSASVTYSTRLNSDYAINPILYNAMSLKFRRAFRRVLCCGTSSSLSSASTTNYSTRHRRSISTSTSVRSYAC